MNFIDQWQAKQEFNKAVKELDVSGGIPLNTAEQAENNSDLKTYLDQLARVDLGLKEIVDQPQKIFYGEAKNLEHAMLVRTRRDTPPQSPPRETFQAELGTILTTQVEPTLAQLTRLTAFNLKIVDPQDQEALVNQTMDSLKNDWGSSFTDIGDDWTLRLVVANSLGKESWITPRLIPVPKDEYSADWIERQTRNLKRTIRPESLSEQIDKKARRNFCVRDVTLAEVDPFDLGGNGRMDEIIQKAGYRKTDNGDALTARPSIVKIYCHEDLESDETAPLLGVEESPYRDPTIKLLAIVPHALSAQIRQGFQKEIQAEAGKIVKERIKKGLKSGGDVDLSPDVVTTEALKKLEHHIVSDDYEDQLDWLCSVVLDETLKEMTRYPKTKDASALLNQARRLSAAAQRIDDRVEIEAESLDAMFSLGWSPDKVALVFPATMFTKKQ